MIYMIQFWFTGISFVNIFWNICRQICTHCYQLAARLLIWLSWFSTMSAAVIVYLTWSYLVHRSLPSEQRFQKNYMLLYPDFQPDIWEHLGSSPDSKNTALLSHVGVSVCAQLCTAHVTICDTTPLFSFVSRTDDALMSGGAWDFLLVFEGIWEMTGVLRAHGSGPVGTDLKFKKSHSQRVFLV